MHIFVQETWARKMESLVAKCQHMPSLCKHVAMNWRRKIQTNLWSLQNSQESVVRNGRYDIAYLVYSWFESSCYMAVGKMRNAESKMQNLKCRTMLIGQSSKPCERWLSAAISQSVSGKMQARNAENVNSILHFTLIHLMHMQHKEAILSYTRDEGFLIHLQRTIPV